MLSGVTKGQWEYWKKTYPAPGNARRMAGELLSFDAHFHFDRLCHRLNTRSWYQLEERGREQPPSLRRDQQGGCTSFCDVATWPSAADLEDMPPPIYGCRGDPFQSLQGGASEGRGRGATTIGQLA